MQEFPHILQEEKYGKYGYYFRYIYDIFRCHLEPLLWWLPAVANVKSSYKNPRYFEGEAHQIGEPIGHLIFLKKYIEQITWETVDGETPWAKYFHPDTHPTIQGQDAYMIALLCNDYFDEFQWRKSITKNQDITRSTHLSDYNLARQWIERASVWTKTYALPIPDWATHHPHGICIEKILLLG